MTHDDPSKAAAVPSTSEQPGGERDPRAEEIAALRARLAELERQRPLPPLPSQAGAPVQGTLFPLQGPDGNAIAQRVIPRDTTAVQEHTLRLLQQLKLLKDILDNSTAVIFVRNTAGRYILVNRRYEELFRITTAAIEGKSDFDLFPKEVAEKFYANDMEVVAAGHPVELEEAVPSEDGIHTYITLKFPIRDLDGAVYAVCGISTDITERKRAEQERAALQLEIIRTQESRVRELSTPLIPLADGVLVMPIIGTIDSVRAQQIMQTLLEGISAERASIAILDITAVSVVDTQSANALLQAATAARLLGAEVVLTGIGAPVAQTLVQLGANLGSVRTLRTLQSGIAYALGRRRA